MIVKDNKPRGSDPSGAESSNHHLLDVVPPPPFEEEPTESQQHPLVDFAEGDDHNLPSTSSDTELGPPPDFSPYHADYFETSSGDVVSHDPHLNTDGEALYRFLLAQAERSPLYRLHCRGTHDERHTRWVSETNSQGRTESRRETYTETVTDFDFYIDIRPPHTLAKPIHWSVADAEPVYRGLMVRELELNGNKRKAKRAENKAYSEWLKERNARGLPPWISGANERSEGALSDVNSLKSSKTLRQWADEYCISQKYLKEFVYDKVLYGWNLQQLESAIRSSIKGTMYRGSLHVEFTTHGSKIIVRPDNRLSRMLSNKWLKFLSIILFIFPFIWLFKRFHPRGGGFWAVCGGAYALQHWALIEPLVESHVEEESPQYHVDPRLGGMQDMSSSRIIQTPNGVARLIGLREGDWFRRWEGTITRAVMGNYQSSIPIVDTGNHNLDSIIFNE